MPVPVNLDVHVHVDGGQRFSPHVSETYPSNVAPTKAAIASAAGAGAARLKNIRKPDH
jgi:hypothetical protein